VSTPVKRVSLPTDDGSLITIFVININQYWNSFQQNLCQQRVLGAMVARGPPTAFLRCKTEVEGSSP